MSIDIYCRKQSLRKVFRLIDPSKWYFFCLQGFRPSPTCGPSESCAGRSSRAARCPTDAPRTRRSWNEFNEDKSFRGRNSVRIKSTRFYFGDFLTSLLSYRFDSSQTCCLEQQQDPWKSLSVRMFLKLIGFQKEMKIIDWKLWEWDER